ncbi:MAG: tyrosine--tRNA ligase [Verrucomicrobia bacterium]|nr:tyrosine--tRNA ligase [Verrucomicrobiota bacterium]
MSNEEALAESEKDVALLSRGSVDLIQRSELVKKLVKSKQEGIPLKIKAGIDPTSPHLHLGHVVLFQKMKQFQDLGHEVTVLIGDFTGMIGDPTGRSEIRKQLTREVVLENAETYKAQIFKLLDPKRTKVRFNSEWMDSMPTGELIQLASQYTVARILERDDFQKRYQASHPIGIHEFLYPLIQGYDSVALKSDVELGGTDQKFNLLVGRTLQKAYGQAQQVVLTVPLLEGTDGVRKMSKSFANDIALESTPFEMFGKTMSISDELMWRFFELLTDESIVELKQRHPMEAKLYLASTLVARFHGSEKAKEAQDRFNLTVGRKGGSKVAPEIVVGAVPVKLVALIHGQGWADSKGKARRLIQQGAVEINQKKIIDPAYEITLSGTDRYDIKIGKKKRYSLVRGD